MFFCAGASSRFSCRFFRFCRTPKQIAALAVLADSLKSASADGSDRKAFQAFKNLIHLVMQSSDFVAEFVDLMMQMFQVFTVVIIAMMSAAFVNFAFEQLSPFV